VYDTVSILQEEARRSPPRCFSPCPRNESLLSLSHREIKGPKSVIVSRPPPILAESCTLGLLRVFDRVGWDNFKLEGPNERKFGPGRNVPGLERKTNIVCSLNAFTMCNSIPPLDYPYERP
jgi:hypothetical protein